MIGDHRDVLQGVLEPVEVLSPAEFAERHRVVQGGPFAGEWDNENGPYLVDVMNAAQEALETGRNVVCIKGAQMAVTEALGINVVAWLLTFYGGPILYLTAKEKTAEKLVRDRWDGVLKTCAPLARKHLAGRLHGELVLQKRFTDGSLRLAGSRSLLNFISDPYCVVIFDELDSCAEVLADGSDPIAIIGERLTAMAEGRPVLMIAFAHPTTKTRGAAKLYYEHSDQRRAHVACPHCGRWVAPLWEQVRPFPREGESPADAERDPSRYALVAPCCGAVWSEADRLKAITEVRQLSTLEPELARTKDWIGLHVWHFFMRKAGSIPKLAKKHVAALEDEGRAVVFRNKVLGDAFELDDEGNPDEDAWRACSGGYARGEVPAEVALLTAGTDHNERSLHWTIWGWGTLPATDGSRVRCGWLIDWGEVKRDPPAKSLDAADLLPLEQLVVSRAFRRADGKVLRVASVGHDTGWLPDGVYEFADARAGRSVAIKGASEDLASRNPILRWGKKPKRFVRTVELPWRDERLGLVNTFLAKRVFLGLVRRRFALARGAAPATPDQLRLHVPHDVDQEVLEHLSSERLTRRAKKVVWETLPGRENHLLDCSIYAYALAEQAAIALRGKTADEIEDARPPAPTASKPEKEKRTWKIGR